MQQEVQYTKEKRTRAKKRELIVLLSMQRKGVDLELGRLFCVQKSNQWKWHWRKRRMKMALVPKVFGSKEKTMKKLYAFLNLAAEDAKWHHVDWGFETLKMLYTKGYVQSRDAGRLGALVRSVDEKGEYDCALRLMNAFVTLYRHAPQYRKDMIAAITVIALYAYRNKREALLAKCADYLCRIAMDDEQEADEWMPAIKQIGSMAIRRQDGALLREIMSRIITVCYLRSVSSDKLVTLLVTWLEKILHQGDASCYEIWSEVFARSITQEHWSNEAMLALIESCRPLVGLSAMNPYAPIMRQFLADMLYYSELQGDIACSVSAVQIVGMAMRIAVQDHPPTLAIPYTLPLTALGASLSYRQVQYPGLYEAGDGQILTAVWQAFILLDKELEEGRWGDEQDQLLMIYESYRTTFPITKRDMLWWRSLFAYRSRTENKPIPQCIGRLNKKERTALIR